MLLLIYLKSLSLIIILFFCGLTLLKRASVEKRAQVLIPAGAVLGIALYIFLLNAVAHFLKGPPGFYLALIIEILLAFILKTRIKEGPIIFPTGRLKVIWLISLSIWTIFLYLVTSTGHALSGDAANHYIFASLFSRGDYPMHSPYQPDYIAFYHLGGAELLGAFQLITSGSNKLLFSLFSFISFLAMSQILSFLIKTAYDKLPSLILFFLVPAVGLISLGGFMLVWPYQLAFPYLEGGFIKWLGDLPVFGAFGASTSLDNFSLFFHRVLSMSFFIAILPIILYPKISSYILPASSVMIILATIALTDESVFIVIAPAIVIVSLFTIFKRSLVKCILFGLLTLVVAITQGGIITESVLNRNNNLPAVLIFPPDQTGPMKYYHQYRSYRLKRMESDLFPDKEHYIPFRWLHPGIFWQLSLILSLTILSYFLYKDRNKDDAFIYLLWLLFLSSLSALVAYNALVPEGMFHANGNRFLGLSFHLSGLGIAFFIFYWWKIINYTLKLVIVWILIFSIIPSLAHTFPLQKYNWFFYKSPADKPLYSYIRANIPFENRIIMLTESFPVASANEELVMSVGALTSLWTPQYYAQGFDVNPTYSDLFYTLNPKLLKILKADYIVVGNEYLPNIPKKRLADLQNPEFFKLVYIDPTNGNTILRILPKYLSDGESFGGTFDELTQIAPKEGSYFIERVPGIAETMYRATRLALVDRELYYSFYDAFYNFVINVDMKYYGEHQGKYDFLVLSEKTDPKTICNCDAKLLWEGLGNGIKLWQVI